MGTTVDDIEQAAERLADLIRMQSADTAAESKWFLQAVTDLAADGDAPALRVAAARAESLHKLVNVGAFPNDGRVLGHLEAVDTMTKRALRWASASAAAREDDDVSRAVADRVYTELARLERARTGMLAERLGLAMPQVSRALHLLMETKSVVEVESPTRDRRQRWYATVDSLSEARTAAST